MLLNGEAEVTHGAEDEPSGHSVLELDLVQSDDVSINSGIFIVAQTSVLRQVGPLHLVSRDGPAQELGWQRLDRCHQ